MKQYKLKTTHRKILADTITPVSIYLKIRDRFPNSLLLESSDYHGNENSFSYICFNPIATVKLENEGISKTYPDNKTVIEKIENRGDVIESVAAFAQQFKTDDNKLNFMTNGLFGYIGFEAVRYFDTLDLTNSVEHEIPDLIYSVYQNIIAIDHFKNEAYIFSNHFNADDDNLTQIEALICAHNFASFQFELEEEEQSDYTDDEFKELVQIAKEHCYRGDVFQLVLSRKFRQKFKGDEFNVYRALRSVNPSPYLFYFDYGNFKIFGSSPEAQLVVKGNKAKIHPIAGTFKRTGDDQSDMEQALLLSKDEKENAEHVMLVDLARNDLSRHGNSVTVETFKEVQFYSHVIHLVSEVTAEKVDDATTLELVADTFPAGTLSGAPKHKALQLINRYEKEKRQFYGGCIGFLGFNGDFNSAIIIRSFLSRHNELVYQAGAGIVADSSPEGELQEVYNKLAALKQALLVATTVNQPQKQQPYAASTGH